jgi:signal recognition particle receptor subunit beta
MGGKGLHGDRLRDRVGSHKEDTTVVVVSYSGKEINAKLVYYGAGLSGKTTNLEAIYEAVPDTSRGKMVSMKTQSDRTLFFDLLPLDLGEIMGFKTRFLLYTVPGQVFYNATRKLVLKGADAIVFVADSEVGKMEENKESIENLKANLAEYKISLDDLPWVIQYNKRDIPNVYTCEELNAVLNPGGKVPFFEAVATQGKGVFETFRGISHLLMEKVTKDLRRGPAPATRPAPVAPVAEEPAKPAPPAAPPMAPVRAISREAQEAVAANGGGEQGLDYGREIELPDTFPPAGEPMTVSAPAPAPAPRVTVPIGAEAAAPVRAAAPAPAPARPAPVVEAPPPAPMRPAPVAEVVPAPVRHAPLPVRGAPAAVEATEAQQIVVPVTLPPGSRSAELVIRIILQQPE